MSDERQAITVELPDDWEPGLDEWLNELYLASFAKGMYMGDRSHHQPGSVQYEELTEMMNTEAPRIARAFDMINRLCEKARDA